MKLSNILSNSSIPSRRERIKNSYLKKILLLVPVLLILSFASYKLITNINVGTAVADFDGGDGDTQETAYIINTYAQWVEMIELDGETNNKYFELGADIEIGEGYDNNHFWGTLDGKNFKITGLTIPLFGELIGADVKNLNIEDADISIGDETIDDIGILARFAEFTEVDNVNVSGVINVDSIECRNIGGLIGYSADETNILDSHANIIIDAPGCEYVGGLVGVNSDSSISNSSSTGTINSSYVVGGLVGYNNSDEATTSIEGSFSSVDVTADDWGIGGLVGLNDENISESYATGNVINTGNNATGGLVGANYGVIENAYATGDATGRSRIGGFAGSNEGQIYYSYSTGDVHSTPEDSGWMIGGFVGENGGDTIYSSFSTGEVTVTGEPTNQVGGFIGVDLLSYYNSGWWTGAYDVAIGYDINDSGNPVELIDWNVEDKDEFKNESFLLFLASSIEEGHEYDAWNFDTLWTTNGGTTYPLFGWSEETDEEEENEEEDSSTPKSSAFSVSTPPGCGSNLPVGTPDLFQTDRTTSSSVTLNFTSVIDNTKSYHIIYGYSKGDFRFGILNVGVEGSGVQQITINDLEPNIAYYFLVAPVNGCAVGNSSNWLEAGGATGSYFK